MIKQTLAAAGLTAIMTTAATAETPWFVAPHIQTEIDTSELYDTSINADECIIKEVDHMRGLLDEMLEFVVESGAVSAKLVFTMSAQQMQSLKEYCEFTTQSHSEGNHPYAMGGFSETLELEF